jgi:hypothetical protein
MKEGNTTLRPLQNGMRLGLVLFEPLELEDQFCNTIAVHRALIHTCTARV